MLYLRLTIVKSKGRASGDVARVLSGKASGVQVTNQGGISGSGTSVIIRGLKYL